MSIVRIGSNDKYASGWSLAFAGKKAAAGAKSAPKKASPKKKSAKKGKKK